MPENKRRPSTAQYRRLILISQIAGMTESLLQSLDIPKAIAQMKAETVSDEETAESWAEMARQAARNLQALADKLAPKNETPDIVSAVSEYKQDEPEKAKRPRGTGSVFQMKGSAVYWIKYYRDGKPVRESSGSPKVKTAENLLKQRIGELATNNWIAPSDRKITIDDLYAGLLADYQNNGMASLEGAQQRWEWTRKGDEQPTAGRLKKFFSGIRAIAVNTDMLNRYAAECREQGLSNGTINRDMAALRRAFTIAKRAGKIQSVPFFPHLKEPKGRKGFVEESDYSKLAKNAKALWMRAMLATAYTFGFRVSELLNLRVSQIDLAERIIRLNAGETKNGEGREACMTQDVYTLIQACVTGKGPDEYVFTREGEPILDFRGAWETLTKAAGRPGLLFHDLRRSAVRNMIRRGIPEVVAMSISGHQTRAVFDRYNIVSPSDHKEAARKIEAGKGVWAENGQSLKPETQQQMAQAAGKQVN